MPNVVNLARRTPATHMLVVRHRDRPGVLAHVFDHLRKANLNVQETENIVFEGAEAAVARINLDGEPPPGAVRPHQGRQRRRHRPPGRYRSDRPHSYERLFHGNNDDYPRAQFLRRPRRPSARSARGSAAEPRVAPGRGDVDPRDQPPLETVRGDPRRAAKRTSARSAGIPANYKVLFLQGGASLQFSMVPMNLLPPTARPTTP